MITALREQPAYAFLSASVALLLFPIVQTVVTPLAFEIWFRTLIERPASGALFVVFSILFGMLVPLYIYSKNKCFDCKKRDVDTGVTGAITGFIFGVCPACISVIGLFLPLGLSILLTVYAPVFTASSIGMILFSIWRLGGFKK
jgi:hypothetical protein